MAFATLLMRYQSEGAAQVKSDMKTIRQEGAATQAGVKKLADGVKTSFQGVSPVANQAARSFEQFRASVDPAFAASQQFAAAQKEVAAFVSSGTISQQTANTVLEQAASKYMGVATAAERAATAQRENERAVNEATQGYNALRMSLDPVFANSKRYEAAQEQLNTALRQGVITQQEHARTLSLAENQYLAAGRAAQVMGAQTQVSTGHTANLGAQFNDIGVMLAAGQSPLMLAVQQGSQINQVLAQMGGGRQALRGLAAGFMSMVSPLSLATIGIIAGGAALVQWAMKAFEAKDGASELEEAVEALNKAISEVRTNNEIAMSSLTDLRAEYGRNAEAVRDNARALRELAAVRAVVELENTVNALASSVSDAIVQFERLESRGRRGREEQLSALAAEVGFTADEARKLRDAFSELAKADGLEASRDAAQNLYDEMVAVFGSASKIPPELQEAARQALNAANTAHELDAAMNGSANSAAVASNNAGTLTGQIAAAAAQARVLVANLGFVPTALGGLAETVASQVQTMTVANAALRDQIDNGTNASIAAIKAERNALLNRMELEGADMVAQADAIQRFDDKIAVLEGLTGTNEGLTKSLEAMTSETSKSGGAASKAAKDYEKLANEIQQLEFDADPIKRFNAEVANLDKLLENGLSDRAYANAVADLNDELANNYPLIGDVADAWSDFVVDGFEDFRGFVDNVLSSFKGMLAEMISTAARNRILVGVGLTGGAGQAAAGQGGGILSGGGLLNGLWGTEAAPGLLGGSGLLGAGGGSGFLGLGAGSGLANTLGGGALGSALSFALPALGVGAVLTGLFKKTEVLVAEGVRARIDGATLELDSYEKTKTDNGFGFSSGFSRDFDRLDDAVQATVGAQLDATINALDVFGIGTDLTGFSFSKRTEIKSGESFEGESEEVIREALDAAITYLSDGALEVYQLTGEGLSDTLERLTTSFNGVNETLYLLDQNLLPLSLDGASAASALLELSGGLDAFSQKSSVVFTGMLTDVEQQARLSEIAMEALGQTFDQFKDVSLPNTHAEFMALMDAQDLSTEAGRELYAALLDVADEFVVVHGTAQEAADAIGNDLAPALDGTADAARELAAVERERQSLMQQFYRLTGDENALRQMQLDGLDESNRALQQQIWGIEDANDALNAAQDAVRGAFGAEIDRVRAAYQDQIDAANASADAANAIARAQSEESDRLRQERISVLEAQAEALSDRVSIYRTISDALERAYTDRRVLTAIGQRMQLASAQAFLRGAVAAGGTDDVTRLEQALEAVADPSTALFSSFAEYQQDFNVNTNLIEELRDISDGALTVEERSLRALNEQIETLRDVSSDQVESIQANTSAIEAARDMELAALESQMNALLGIDTSVMSVSSAISQLAAAQRAVDAATGGSSGGSSVSGSINSGNANTSGGSVVNDSGSYALTAKQASAINAAYANAFGYTPNGALTTWGREINRDGRSLSEVISKIYGFAGMDVPSYSRGTDFHPGGWARLHQNEMVNLPRGTGVSTASEVRQAAEERRKTNELLRENNARMRELQLELNRQGRTQRDEFANGSIYQREKDAVA